MADDNPKRAITLAKSWSEHGWPILLYLLLSLAFTWPMAAHFTTKIPGDGYDAYNGLWVMWHTKEALLGHQPLFDLPTLYYPYGASLFTHVPGLTTGFFALPFWPLGPEAAHNGAVLISFILTGYFTYLLGRTIGLKKPVAFFAGLLLLVAPMHLLGLRGHTTKVFLGAAPLVLLCLFRTFDLNRSKKSSILWALATALALLLAMLHDSFQFLTAGMAVLLVTTYLIWNTKTADRPILIKRFLIIIAASLIIVGPLLYATARSALDPNIVFDLNFNSFEYQPDLLEFIVPSTQGYLLGPLAAKIFDSFNIQPLIETAVSISLAALPLILISAVKRVKQAWFWLLFTFVWLILSFGPTVRLLNHTTFTEYDLPIIMPYAFFTELPGLGFLRTPGRFMQIGFVGIAISAALGLSWLRQRWPKQASLITAGAILLVILESWPQPWQMITLRPTPDFYQQIAEDDEMYGVLDLPITSHEHIPNIMYNATYQIYQMAHGKGIPMGYISRSYRAHPLFPCLYDQPNGELDLRVNGEPAPCPFQPTYDLPLNNYRYLVVHKPQPSYFDYKPGTFGDLETAEFIAHYLSDQTPIMDDNLTTVYEMPQFPDISALDTTVGFGDNWYGPEEANGNSWHWAQSPAEIILTSATSQHVTVEIMFFIIYQPLDVGSEYQSRIQVALDGQAPTFIEGETGKLTTIPLELTPGEHSLILNLEAGNYQPTDLGSDDPRFLSFAVNYINLKTSPSPAQK